VASSSSATTRSSGCNARWRRSSAIASSATGSSSTACRWSRAASTTAARTADGAGPDQAMAVAQVYSSRPVDIRVGEIELRLAETPAEVEAAQALRYRVFY